jgi:hypothetical protein
MKRRLLLSVAAGILIPSLAAFAGAYLVGDLEGHRWLVRVFAYVVAWPLILLRPFFPEDNDVSQTSTFMRVMLYFSALFLDFLMYFLLTYALLWWRAKRGHRVFK